MSNNLDIELKKVLDVHYSDKHKEIRRLYPDDSDCYEPIIMPSIEKNLNYLKQNICKNVKDKVKLDKIFKLAKKYVNVYEWNYNDNIIDKVIKEKTEVDSFDPDSIKAYKINKNFDDDEKKLLNRNFDNRFIYKKGKVILDFVINSKGKINVNQASYKINQNEEVNLKKDFEGLTLKQAVILLDEYSLKDAKSFVNSKRKEYEYKTEVINDIYQYIIYLMMYNKKDIKSAKRAMIFAQHNNIDMKIPLRYVISSNDRNVEDVVNYYCSICTDDTEIFIDYFETKSKLINLIYNIKKIYLSDIIVGPKTRKKI